MTRRASQASCGLRASTDTRPVRQSQDVHCFAQPGTPSAAALRSTGFRVLLLGLQLARTFLNVAAVNGPVWQTGPARSTGAASRPPCRSTPRPYASPRLLSCWPSGRPTMRPTAPSGEAFNFHFQMSSYLREA
jgi:hypothetical protein